MKRIVLSLALALTVPAVALACDGDKEHNANADAVKNLTVPELAALQKEKKVQVFDANGPETRAKYGVIPGAVLLTSAVKFDPAKELPAKKDSKVVFYCANTMCSASESAAERAVGAGFTDVSVLKAGIKGWKEAGQATALPRS